MVVSGVLGIVGAVEIAKCAQLHKLNTLHLRYNHGFWQEVLSFSRDNHYPIAPVKNQLILVRQQPVDGLQLMGPLERAVISLTGTYRAITICEADVVLADQLLASIEKFMAGQLSRSSLSEQLRSGGGIFLKDSVEFEALVDRTTDAVATTVVRMVIVMAFLVGVCGWIMARSVHSDFMKLQSTEDTLETRNQELENFVYRASHDFRSPLLGIISIARFVDEDIREGNLDEALDNIGRIQANVRALESVTLSTLQMAKTDLADVHAEPIDLEDLLQCVWSRLAEMAEHRQVRLQIGDGVRETIVHSDASRLQVAIEHLVSNAIEFSNEQQEQPLVFVDAEELAGGWVEIRVQDNGIGIPAERTPEVFSMFKQFHPQRATGSGLGLYIVNKSVERLGGTIEFSTSANGTSFRIRIPNVIGRKQKHATQTMALAN